MDHGSLLQFFFLFTDFFSQCLKPHLWEKTSICATELDWDKSQLPCKTTNLICSKELPVNSTELFLFIVKCKSICCQRRITVWLASPWLFSSHENTFCLRLNTQSENIMWLNSAWVKSTGIWTLGRVGVSGGLWLIGNDGRKLLWHALHTK